MLCSNCGQENPAESKFCFNCGEKLETELDATVSFLLPADSLEEEKAVDLDRLAAKEGPLLVIVKGRDVGRTFPLGREKISIGRDPQSDIFLNDITVSRKHALISLEGSLAKISDIGSLNGTYVNRERIDETVLSDRDELQIGKFKMVFLAKG